MKLITVIIIGVFTITSAIRVPTSWPKKQNVQQIHHKFRPNVGSEIGFQARPHVVQTQKHNQINSGRKYTNVRHRNLKKPEATKEFKPSATLDEWKPVFPTHVIQKDNSYFANFKHPQLPNYKQVTIQKSPLYKNYRDDRTHEPETETIEEKHIHRETPSSLGEDIPTRPFYQGQGQWAKKGIKHQPHITKHRFAKPEDEEEERPEGYETFEQNRQLFERQQDKFRENIDQFPQKHKLGAYVAENEEEDAEEEEEEEPEFVPTRIYTQVRRSENEEHLPRLVEDPRLKEVIKDSKIQTVYTEEGYEDIAYDHAGHEKTAEEDEGFAEFDKEIEKEKQKKAQKIKDEDSETAGSHPQSVKKPLKMRKDKFLKTQEVKTTSLKNQENGSELEVSSQIKILESPENGTKAHKYVKIFPKTYRYDKAPTEETTTVAVTRVKRYTNDFPKITIDTDFIDKIHHNLPKQYKSYEKPKYPYYNDPTINPYSPLRYAEDLDNIPKKTEDDLAFYNQADKTECQEVQSDVDPIPARVKNADADPENMEDATDVQELVQAPRLKNLGDKIDCFKIKYFGENPLDSPIFQEKEIGPVLPIFGTFKRKPEIEPNEIEEENRSYSTKVAVQTELKKPVGQRKDKPGVSQEDLTILADVVAAQTELKKPVGQRKNKSGVSQEDLTILADVVKQFNKSEKTQSTNMVPIAFKLEVLETKTAETKSTTVAPAALKLEVVEPKVAETVNNVENQTEASVISIITTPKYTIDLKPKHIYHQIELLEYLPHYNTSISDVNKTEPETTTETTTETRSGKSLEEEATTSTPTEEPSPESQPLMYRRRRPRPRRPAYQIFDVNKYLPQNTYALINKILRTSTMSPKRDVTGEIQYQEEVKASEQLNVFADIINNIKNSSKDPQQIAASSNRVAVKMNFIDNYRKIPVVEPDNLDDIEETNSFYLTTTTKAPRGTIKYSSYKTKEHLFEDMSNRDKTKYENLELLKVNKKLTTTTEPYSTDTRSSASSVEEEKEEEVEEQTTDTVLGLMPPDPNKYKTIFRPIITKPVYEETKMNLFYVLGMKPPSAKQKVYLYSDFKTYPYTKAKYAHLRRGRRSAQRPAYSEVLRNRNKPIDVDDDTEVVVEDDDDYVPHRPRNYHYDEKTGRIVYDNVKKETEAPEEEYIEVTDAPIPKPTRKNVVTTPKFEDYTGPSFVDFVKKLKTSANYTEIPDPPSTEKGEEVTTTTAKPVSTEPPEFLKLLNKVRTDSSYKMIADKTTVKTTTTTEAPEEEEEETQLENVQNSPGGQTITQNFQIFDINEYLPKVKNYTPRTSIDYSKYKTIERANVPLRHNLSSRYNSEEEDLENVKTSRVPILLEEKKGTEQPEINPVMSESKHEDVEPSTTTTTESSTTTTRRTRSRPKSRGTRRSTTVASVTTTTSSPVSEETVQNAKPKRLYPRRRPTRIKLSRTTEVPDSEIEESTSAKIIRRRHPKTEDVEEEEIPKSKQTHRSASKLIRRRQSKGEDVPNEKIEEPTSKNTSETVLPKKEETSKAKQSRSESRKTADVQVFQKYDQSKKHGGNYRKENEEIDSNKESEVKRLTDVVHKPSAYFTDPKLPKKVNQLMEVKVEEDVEELGGESEEPESEETTLEYDYEGSEDKTTTTKKPVFVKDPDKRMYFYAPI